MTDYISNINDNPLDGNVFNGQYSGQDTSVFTNVTFTANQWRTYSLASIIPDDDYDYEVLFEVTASTGTTSGNLVDIQLYSGTATSSNNANNFHTRVGRCCTRTSSNQRCGGIGILPINASDKKVTVRNSDGSGTSGNYNCYVKRLRRIGTNKKSNDTKYISNINSHPIGGKTLDSQWINSTYDIASGLSIAKDVIKEYDLSSYLPDDNYSYDVMFFVNCRTGTTSGNTAIIRVGNTNYTGNPIIVNQITRASSYMQNGGNGKVVIGADRKIYIGNSGNATSTNINFSVRAYRRVGTNSTTNIPNICIKSDEQVPNALIYGNPTITSGVVSDFSESSYLEIPDGKQDNNAEYIIKFTPDSTTSTDTQSVLCAEKFLVLEMASIASNLFAVTTYNWETASNVNLFTASANTTYWVKIEIDTLGNKIFRYSTDGVDYARVADVSDNSIDITANYPMRIGNHSKNSNLTRPFLGSVDLNETYINVNGVRFWNGMDYKKYIPIGGDIADGQWTKKGQTIFSATTLSNGSHNYTVNNYLPEDDTPYEISVFSYGRTDSTSGHSATWWIETTDNVIGNPIMGYINTRTASSMCDSKCATIVCTQRNGVITLKVTATNSSTSGDCGLYFDSYRKIGTNE